MKVLTPLSASVGLDVSSTNVDTITLGSSGSENNDVTVDNLTVWANAEFKNNVTLGSSTADTIIINSPVSSSANISASYFFGDGSNLTNLPTGAISSHNAVTLGVANGLSINGTQVLSLSASSATQNGAMTTSSQTFAGVKTFNNDISGTAAYMNYIDFNTGSATPAWKNGRIFWDNVQEALIVYNAEADISLRVGQENWVRARNQTGVLITHGSAVVINGAVGDRPSIALAQAVDESLVTASLRSDILGIAIHDIEHGTDGFVTTLGVVNGLNTSGYTAGDVVWVSEIAGEYTKFPPIAPLDRTIIGIVTRANPSNGSIYVNSIEPIHFHDISSVSASAYIQGNLWMYNVTGSTGVWTNTSQLSGNYDITGSLNINGVLSSSNLSLSNLSLTTLNAADITASAANITTITGHLVGTASFSDNSNLLDGQHSTDFAKIASSNTFTAVNTFSNDITGTNASFSSITATTFNGSLNGTASTAALLGGYSQTDFAKLTASNTFTAVNNFTNAITGTSLFLANNLTVNGTASFGFLNTLSQSSLNIGDKYIIILTGSSDHAILDGSGILWGSSSTTGANTHDELGSDAHVRFNAAEDKLRIFPGLYVSGGTGTKFQDHFEVIGTSSFKANVSGTTAQFTTITGSTITGSNIIFTNITASGIVINDSSVITVGQTLARILWRV